MDGTLREPAPPAPDLARQATDDRVLRELLAVPQLTRAEIAARTGISKPTVSESVRRLGRSGLVEEAGSQSGKRGPAGTFFRISGEAGLALALDLGPGGLVAVTVDLRGRAVAQARRPASSPVERAELEPLVRGLVEQVVSASPRPLLAATISLAGPVDRATGRLVRLPDSPYMVDDFDPLALLGDLLPAQVVVDNDVNWAAVAEHRLGSAAGLDDFVYCYFGAGIGAAIVRGGLADRGSAGLAGEIAHVLTTGPGGASLRLAQCFERMGLRRPGTAAVDVDAVSRVLMSPGPGEHALREDVLRAVAGAIGSLVTVQNPAAVLLGGPWGSSTGFADAVAQRLPDVTSTPTQVRSAAIGPSAPLDGARLVAAELAQAGFLGRIRA